MRRQVAVQHEPVFALYLQHAATAKQGASAYAWARDPQAGQGWAQIARHLREQPEADAEDGKTPESEAG